ncbi:PLP-dependent transferase, partial [Vibrio sp. D173a]|uniref:PLP-dependent transferase n=1 Tax=Vibrio sp. D173a TaxID=2836349 RepID=UPI0025555096
DSGKFPWAQHKDRFPVFNQPEPSYHGVVYTEAFGEAAFIGRARTVPLRNTGAALSPMNSFMLMQGLETLSLRMERHTENALKVAEYLKNHEKVSWVIYAGLPDSEFYPLAEKYMQGKPSAILSFGLKDGYEAGVRFYDALQIFKRFPEMIRLSVGIEHIDDILADLEQALNA